MKHFYSNKENLGRNIKLVEKNELLKNEQEITNELNTFFKDTASNLEMNKNPYIINQILHDIFDPLEKCINKDKFHPSKLLIKNRIKIKNLFSFHATERNDMMRELLKIDPRKAITGTQHPIQNVETKC